MNKDYALLGFVADTTGLSTNDIEKVLRAYGRYKNMIAGAEQKRIEVNVENFAQTLTEILKKKEHTTAHKYS